MTRTADALAALTDAGGCSATASPGRQLPNDGTDRPRLGGVGNGNGNGDGNGDGNGSNSQQRRRRRRPRSWRRR